MKIWAYIILAGILIAAIGGAYKAVHAAGYNKRDAEVKEELIEQQNAAIKKGIEDWAATQDAAETQIVIEEKIIEVIREIEKEVRVEVERIVEVSPECSDLGLGYARVLNNQVNASNGRESAESASELVTRLPRAFELPVRRY